jgi:hypothetical protein
MLADSNSSNKDHRAMTPRCVVHFCGSMRTAGAPRHTFCKGILRRLVYSSERQSGTLNTPSSERDSNCCKCLRSLHLNGGLDLPYHIGRTISAAVDSKFRRPVHAHHA